MPDNREPPGPTLQLVIDVEYSPGTPPAEELRPMLERQLREFLGSGGLTSNTPAEVDGYSTKVIGLSPGAARLTEDELATWISLQVESGSFSLEELPRRMAIYALANPADMRNEFAERMGLDNADRYLFSVAWATAGTQSLKQARWVVDLEVSKLIFAELQTETGGWRPASAIEARTLIHELQPQIPLATAGDHTAGARLATSSSKIPDWAQASLSMSIDLESDDLPMLRDGAADAARPQG